MDRAEELARSIGADLVLATDPDADRLGAMVAESVGDSRQPATHHAAGTVHVIEMASKLRDISRKLLEEMGREPTIEETARAAGISVEETRRVLKLSQPQSISLDSGSATDHSLNYRYLTGNEIGALLTHFKLSKLAEQGRMPPSPIVIKTEVTTSLVTRIARHFKAQVVENLLVGFKYIADVLGELEQKGCYEDVRGTPDDFVIGVEESHGILVTPHIRDKDAASAALLLAELVLDQKRRGRSVAGYLDGLYRQFGYFRNRLANLVMTGIQGKQDMARMLDRLRAEPLTDIGGLAVTSFEDLRDEASRMGPIKGATDLAARNVLVFRLGEQARIVLRPSGTEPKAKAYIEVGSAPVSPGSTVEGSRQSCQEVDELAERLAKDFVEKALGKV
jgi:phosphoglucomutase/phosphomannomutase